jgi:hypothetical protein
VAVANSGSGNVSVLSANSDGSSFSGPVAGSPFATGLQAPTALAVGDFNGDNNTDIALADGSGAGPANVAVLLANGQGGFAPAPGSPFPSGGVKPDAISAGDFNDDGNLDLAVANFASNTVSILLGDGHGHFALAPGSPFSSGGTGPSGLAAWDFTGAGREDLAVINGTSNTLAMFAGDGTGRLTPEPGFPVPTGGSGGAGIVAGDLNGDALGDLALANRLSHNVSILLNTSTPPAFPLLGSARVHRKGTITLRLQAPAAGIFTTLVSATHGGQHRVDSGGAQPEGRAVVREDPDAAAHYARALPAQRGGRADRRRRGRSQAPGPRSSPQEGDRPRGPRERRPEHRGAGPELPVRGPSGGQDRHHAGRRRPVALRLRAPVPVPLS